MKFNFGIFLFLFLLVACSEKNIDPEIPESPIEEPIEELSEDAYWWPKQKAPKQIVTCTFDFNNRIENAIAESVQGLAAQSVNEGKGEEMVWLSNPIFHYPVLFEQIKSRLNLTVAGDFSLWGLVDRYKEKGIIKGYILYKEDTSPGNPYTPRPNMNVSINNATVLAAFKQGILIEESVEQIAKNHGLEMLADARPIVNNRTFYNEYKDQVSKTALLLSDPRESYCRHIAIANKLMVTQGSDFLVRDIMLNVKPLSMSIGWNCLVEGNAIKFASQYGLQHTATNWTYNLSLLSAGYEKARIKKINSVSPRTIRFDEGKHFHSFMMSDGDNLGILVGSFADLLYGESYMKNPDVGTYPISWTACPAALSMGSPDTWNTLVETIKPEMGSIVEYGGGYHFPDFLGEKVPSASQEEIYRKYARRINEHMGKTGVKIFGFIILDYDSPAAHRAYRIMAEEMDNAIGFIAIQYHPYQAGGGKIIWVKNKNGIDVPVVTAKFCLSKADGHPGQIAAKINTYTQEQEALGEPSFAFTIVTAWTPFVKNGDQIDHYTAGAPGEIGIGVKPIRWTLDLLNKPIKNVPLEELIWRIRMHHNPAETKKIVGIN